MELITRASWSDIALTGSVAISWLAMGLALYCLYKLRRELSTLHKCFQRLSHEQQLSNNSAVGVGRRLIAVERKLSITESRQLQMQHQEGEQVPYAQAVHLLNSGVPADEVVRVCGLSRAEVSLMEMMHRHMKESVT